MTADDIDSLASRLSKLQTPSTEHMGGEERVAGIRQMLTDLTILAVRDGCVAAAWAMETLKASQQEADRKGSNGVW